MIIELRSVDSAGDSRSACDPHRIGWRCLNAGATRAGNGRIKIFLLEPTVNGQIGPFLDDSSRHAGRSVLGANLIGYLI